MINLRLPILNQLVAIIMVKFVRILFYFKVLPCKLRRVMRSPENNFGLIEENEMFTIEGVFCNGRIGSVIVISVSDVFLR